MAWNRSLAGAVLWGIVGLLASPIGVALAENPAPIAKLELGDWLLQTTEAGTVAVLAISLDPAEPLIRPDAWKDEAVAEKLADGVVEIHTLVADADMLAVMQQPLAWQTQLDHGLISGAGLYAFRDMELVAAWRGDIDAASLADFLDKAGGALSLLERHRRRVDHGSSEIMARLNANKPLIKALLQRRLFVEAVKRLDAMWHEGRTKIPSYAESIHAQLRPQITALAHHSSYARSHFAALRDDLETRLRAGGASRLDLYDWLLLNGAIGDADRIVAWIGRVGETAEAKKLLNEPRLDLIGTLIDAGEWRVAGSVIDSPLGRVQMYLIGARVAAVPNGVETDGAALESRARVESAEVYAACLAAGRVEEADQVLRMLNDAGEFDGLMRVAVVLAAADARKSLPIHLTWLQDAEDEGIAPPSGLRERVENALRNKAAEDK